MRRFFTVLFTLFAGISVAANKVPTSYAEAQRIGQERFLSLKKTNSPLSAHYVVLDKGRIPSRFMKTDNTVYFIDKDYDLNGKELYVPDNSILVFRKGSIYNGTLKSQYAKYCFLGDEGIKCDLSGTWELIAPVYLASERGMKPDMESAGKWNFKVLEEAVRQGINLYLDGTFYLYFPTPLLLTYELNLFGGEFLFSGSAFDFDKGGGICANGVYFGGIDGGVSDSILCGSRKKHPSITTGAITFLNCKFSCSSVFNLEFTYANPVEKAGLRPEGNPVDRPADPAAHDLRADV